MSMYLTNNFKLEEFDCHDGTPVPRKFMNNVLLLSANLQVLRDYIGRPIHVLSGFRTVRYNATLKGASPRSQHLLGKAADIAVYRISPSVIANTIEKLIQEGKMMEGGLGRYKTFTHYDIRGVHKRW